MRGHFTKHSEETKRIISNKKKGSIPWNKNKKTGLVPKTAFKEGSIPWNKDTIQENMKGENNPSKRPEVRLKIGLKHRGKFIPLELRKNWSDIKKEQWKNKEYKEKMVDAIFKGWAKRPTRIEKDFINFFNEHNLPFKYCGNGELIIGGKCPDFVESNGKKICVEVSNKFYKEHLDNRKFDSFQDYEKQRIEHFSKYGWKCLVLWDDELKDKTQVVKKINEFNGGNK